MVADRPRASSLGFTSLALALATIAASPRAARAQVDEDEGGAVALPRRIESSAPGQRRVYVISVATEDGLEAEAQRAGAAARATLRGMDGADWRHADRLFLGYDESALEVLARARARLDAGRQAYLHLELAQAIEVLSGAVADFDAAAPALEDPEDLGQALLFLGASLAFEGRTRETARVFTRLHVQMPRVRPDPNVFNPDVIARFEGARPRDAANPSATIHVESDPPGAIAYVDFLARGATPIDVGGLRGGGHIVRVTRAGATPFVQSLGVRPRGTASARAHLADDERAHGLSDALDRVPDDDVSALAPEGPIATVARMLEVECIGVIRVARGESEGQVALELVVFDVLSGRRLVRGVGSAPAGVGELERGVEQLVSGALEAALSAGQPAVGARVPEPRAERPAPIASAESEPPLVEQWWFWAAIGGAVAVVGASVAIGVAVSDQGAEVGADGRGALVLEF